MIALAMNAGITLHVHRLVGREQPPHRRGGVQGGRARAARGGRDRRRVVGRPLDRRADLAMIAIIDYRMGNLRSVQKGFEHAGVDDVRVTDDPAARRESPTASCCRASGAFRDAAAQPQGERACGMSSWSACRGGRPVCSASVWGCSCWRTSGSKTVSGRVSGSCPGACERLPGGREDSAHRLEHRGSTRGRARCSTASPRTRRSTSCTPTVSFPKTRPVSSGVPSTACSSRRRCRCGNVFAVQFHPEKSSEMGLQDARELRRDRQRSRHA